MRPQRSAALLATSGADVTVRNAAGNGALPPNGTTTVGFTGTRTGANGAPATVGCLRT